MNTEMTNADLKKLLSRKLALLRQNRKESIEATALDLGMDYSEYHRLLRGDRLPHLLTLLRINRKYGINMDWWFNELTGLPKTKAPRDKAASELVRSYSQLDVPTKKVLLKMVKTLALAKNRKKNSDRP
jgi:transcriptional regulator with XRE-family HTH domain